MSDLPLLEYWYTALRSKIGIKLLVIEGNVENLRQQLYTVRRQSADPDLQKLSLVLNPTQPNEVWICHKNIETDDAAD